MRKKKTNKSSKDKPLTICKKKVNYKNRFKILPRLSLKTLKNKRID